MSSINSTISQLNAATSAVVLALSFASFVPGAIGLVLNVFVFTRPPLRREPCSLYFFSSTCFNLFVIFIVLPVRIVSSSFNLDLANYNDGICKMEFFSFFVVRTISCWLIALACIDRYLHSSPNIRIRRLSSLKTARMAIGLTSISLIILYSHMIVYYDIEYVNNQFGNTVPACNGQKGIYRTFIAFWHMTFYSLCPSFLMLLFGFLTLNNVHQLRRVLPIVGDNNRVHTRTDSQILRMLAAQVLIIIISILPYSINRIYASFTANVTKDTVRVAQENLATQTVNTLANFAHSSSFYLYSLTGSVFRKEIFKILPCCSFDQRELVQTFHGKTNRISVLQKNPQVNVIPIASIHPEQCHAKDEHQY